MSTDLLLPSSPPSTTTPTPSNDPHTPPSQSPTTPTSEEHRIRVPTSPPPAPLKRRRVACKRCLDFFDATHSKEVDDFFASRFAQIQSRRLLKRRFSCT